MREANQPRTVGNLAGVKPTHRRQARREGRGGGEVTVSVVERH